MTKQYNLTCFLNFLHAIALTAAETNHHAMIRCLLIDDDTDDQEIFHMAIAGLAMDVECTVANDCLEALQILQNAASIPPDYIFLDINMPRMNGVQCLREIKTFGHIHGTQIYMFSTTSERKLIDLCIKIGASDFIVKPSGLSALTERLRQVVDQRK
jgi:CheY-like chemotaxis protein